MGRITHFALLITIILSLTSFAEVKFKDVPADHWAAKSVYNLVKLGITSGYPDGTFRGTKSITRFETAIFLSKLAEKIGAGQAKQIQEDLNSIKNDIANMKKSGGPAVIKGSFEFNNMLANLLTQKGVSGKGPIVFYRLKTGIEKNINENASIKAGLDTMDSGNYGGNRDLSKDMIDLEGKLRINPVDLGVLGDMLFAPVEIKVTAGPGIVQHVDLTGIASSENGICYIRPYTGFAVSSKIGEMSIKGNYLVKRYDQNYTGKADTNYGSLSLGHKFNKVPAINNLSVNLTGNMYAKLPNSGGPRDGKLTLDLASEISPKVSINGVISTSLSETKGMLGRIAFMFSNFLTDGTSLNLSGTKVGANYIPPELLNEELGETGFDPFLRPLENATANIDYDFIQPLTEKLNFKSKGNIRLSGDYGFGPDEPKSKTTIQAGLSYLPAADTVFDIYYRAHKDPTIGETTDLSALSVLYKF